MRLRPRPEHHLRRHRTSTAAIGETPDWAEPRSAAHRGSGHGDTAVSRPARSVFSARHDERPCRVLGDCYDAAAADGGDGGLYDQPCRGRSFSRGGFVVLTLRLVGRRTDTGKYQACRGVHEFRQQRMSVRCWFCTVLTLLRPGHPHHHDAPVGSLFRPLRSSHNIYLRYLRQVSSLLIRHGEADPLRGRCSALGTRLCAAGVYVGASAHPVRPTACLSVSSLMYLDVASSWVHWRFQLPTYVPNYFYPHLSDPASLASPLEPLYIALLTSRHPDVGPLLGLASPPRPLARIPRNGYGNLARIQRCRNDGGGSVYWRK